MYINKGETFFLSEEYEQGGVIMVADADVNLNEAKRLMIQRGRNTIISPDESLASWLEERKFAHRVEFKWFAL